MRINNLVLILLIFLLPVCVTASPYTTTGDCTPDKYNDPNNCVNGTGNVVSNKTALQRAAGSSAAKDAGKDGTGEGEASLGQSHLNGLAAGDGLDGWGLWGNFNYTSFDADLPINAAILRARFDGDTLSFFAGADRFVMDRLVLGIAAGYEETSVFTSFNGGDTDSDGFTISPYAAYLINDRWSVDAAFGYTSLDYDTDRISTVNGSTVLGDFDSDRWFVTTNINASHTHNDWFLSGRVGYLYSHEDQDGYTETGTGVRTLGRRKIHLSQIIVGGEAAYNYGHLEPYFGVTYSNDLTTGIARTGSAGGLPGGVAATQDDDDEFLLSFGFRHYGSWYSTVAEFSKVLSRNNIDSHSIMFTFRADL